MVTLRCGRCMLIWFEDRTMTEVAVSSEMFVGTCPRCGTTGEISIREVKDGQGQDT